MHSLTSLIPKLEPVPLGPDGTPYATPAIAGARLDVLPHEGCAECPLAQSSPEHETYDRRRLLNAIGSGPYFGPPPWAPEHTIPSAHWIRRAQAALWFLNSYASRFSTYGWSASGYDYFENAVANPLSLASHPVLSATNNRVIIDTSGDLPDPRAGLAGTPYQVGDGVVFSGNNLAARVNIRQLRGIVDPPAPGDGKPDFVELVLDADVGELAMARADPEEDWTCFVDICRHVQMPEPWAGGYNFEPVVPELGWTRDREHFFYGVRERIVHEKAIAEWDDVETIALGDVDIALPMPGETSRNRTLIVEERLGGEWVDKTSSVSDLYEFDGEGALVCAGGSSVLRLRKTDFSPGATAARITFYVRSVESDYANHAENVGPGQCFWSWPDWGGVWGAADGPHGVTWFCARHKTASGAANFTPRCWQVNSCDSFAPPAPSDFWTMARIRAAVDQLWIGGPPLVLWRQTPIPPNNQIVLYRRGAQSIIGSFTPAAEQEYGNNSVEIQQPLECGAFGRLDENNVWRGGAIHEWPPDSELPAAPSPGALAWLINEARDWQSPWQNLVDGDGLTEAHDPCADWRAWPLYSLAATDRNWGDLLWGDSLSRFQARANGYAEASEQVLLSSINGASTATQYFRDGRVEFGFWDADFAPCAEESAVFGAKVWLYPMPWASVAGPLGSAFAAPGYDGANRAPYVWGQIYSIAQDGERGTKIVIAPGYLGSEIGIWSGGNFCGVPTWARLRIESAPFWYSHLGPHHGARVGHAVSFHHASGSEPGAAAIVLPWLDDDSEPVPADFVIRAVAPFGIVDSEGTQSSVGFHWTTGAIGARGGTLPTLEGYPANFSEWGNVCDAIWVADDDGLLAAAITSEIVGPGDWLLLRSSHTFGGGGDCSAFWTAKALDNWTDISSDLTSYHSANGCYFFALDAAEAMRAAEAICLRFECPTGRIGRTAYYFAEVVNQTRLALEAMTTAQSPIRINPPVGLEEMHSQFLVSSGSETFAPPVEFADGKTYGILGGPGAVGSGSTIEAAKAACQANASGAAYWGNWAVGADPDWTRRPGAEHVGPITVSKDYAFANALVSSYPAELSRYFYLNQLGLNLVPEIAVNLPDGASILRAVVPARVHLSEYVYRRRTTYVSSRPIATWQIGGTYYVAPQWEPDQEYVEDMAEYDPNPPYDGTTGENYRTECADGVRFALVGQRAADGYVEILAKTDAIQVNAEEDETMQAVDITELLSAWLSVRSSATYSAINGVVIPALNEFAPGHAQDAWTYLGEFPEGSNFHLWRVDYETEAFGQPSVSLGTPAVEFGGPARVLVPAEGPPMNMPDLS